MTTREAVHKLIDQIPEQELEAIYRDLEKRLAQHDPVLRAFLEAPESDEPETEEEQAAVAEAYEELKTGKSIPWEKAKRELGL